MSSRQISPGQSLSGLHARCQRYPLLIHRSCAKLSYGDAGAVVDGGSLPDNKVAGHSPADVASDIKALGVSGGDVFCRHLLTAGPRGQDQGEANRERRDEGYEAEDCVQAG